ncbi:MAG TPA: hypothetical protein VFD89_06665 [Clostridia bacterium]|nr:hypothetical protein [Clostridia bacterium]
MRIRNEIIVLIIVLASFAPLLMGCSSGGYAKEIIGEWKVDDLKFKNDSDDMIADLQKMLIGIVFEPDSIIEFINKEKVSLMMNSVNYNWIEEGKLQIGDEDGGDTPLFFDVTIDSDDMTFDNQMVTVYLNKVLQ